VSSERFFIANESIHNEKEENLMSRLFGEMRQIAFVVRDLRSEGNAGRTEDCSQPQVV